MEKMENCFSSTFSNVLIKASPTAQQSEHLPREGSQGSLSNLVEFKLRSSSLCKAPRGPLSFLPGQLASHGSQQC